MTRASAAHPGFAQGVAAAFGAMLIWGGQLPIAKGAFVALDGYSMTVVRYAVAGAALAMLLWWREGRGAFALDGRGRPVLLSGTIGLGGSALLLFVGLSFTRPEVAVIILALQPAMAAIAEWVVERRPPPGFTMACIALAFAGVALVVTRGVGLGQLASLHGTELLGDALVVLASIAWVGYAAVTSRMNGWSALRVSTLTALPALAVILVAWAVAHAFGQVRIDASALPAATWRLAYVSLAGVVIGMFLWNAGLQRTGAVNAMLVLNLMPIVTFAFRAAEGARFEAVELIGAAIVVGALVANNLLLRQAAAAR
ncbi:MAG: DMT family transporter [Burkholderiaceae bacterium]|nr:DMT family transporter [Burkholderiaceae bacterium]